MRARSGFNELKLQEKFDLSKLNARFRRDENFRRLKTGTLARFLNREENIDFLLLDMRDVHDYNACNIVDGACARLQRSHGAVPGCTPHPAPRAPERSPRGGIQARLHKRESKGSPTPRGA